MAIEPARPDRSTDPEDDRPRNRASKRLALVHEIGQPAVFFSLNPALLEHAHSRGIYVRGHAMRLRTWLMAVSVSLASAVPAAAQTQITTGTIEGTVVDASGTVQPGVDGS